MHGEASAHLRATNHERHGSKLVPPPVFIPSPAPIEHIRCICARPDKQVSDVSERETLSRNRRRNDFNHGKLTKVPTKQNATAVFRQVCAVLHQFRFYSDHKRRTCMHVPRSALFSETLGVQT
jgi:hypothetical protein